MHLISRNGCGRKTSPVVLDTALQNRPQVAYIHRMTQPAPAAEHAETEADCQDRFAWEADCLAQADAELDAGLYVDAAELRAWVDSLRTDSVLPPPPTRRS